MYTKKKEEKKEQNKNSRLPAFMETESFFIGNFCISSLPTLKWEHSLTKDR